LADLDRHHFEVECHIEHPDASQRLSLPSWIPGSYLLREFARHVVEIDAHSAGRSVTIEKVDRSSWCCSGTEADLTVRATIYAFDQSVRGSYVDRRRAYFNGPCLFLSPEHGAEEPVELHIEAPADPHCNEWRVATAMQPVDVDARGFGVYQAVNYDELIDHPVEIGDFASVEFGAAGVPHRFVVAGRFDSDLERVAADLRQLCECQIEFFGPPAPFDRYLFLGHAVGNGYGGLEHRASSSLIFNRDDLPKPGETGVPKEYRRFLGLASHEYFHSWHVKRTKPAAFTPYRLDRRNYTRLLWVFEGVTSYYQELMLLRSDLIGVEAYLQRVGEQLTRVYRTPGRFKQSLAEASFDAWDIFYQPEANHPNASISYYTKGALTALALDLTLRRASDAELTLDDIVREMWRRHGARDLGVSEQGFEALAIEFGGDELREFFELAVRGTDDLPLAQLLADFGLALRFRAAVGPKDSGGNPQSSAAPLSIGASFRHHPRGLALVTVFDDGPAQRAGLSPADVVIAIDGLMIDERNLAKRLARLEADERVRVTVFRGDELMTTELTLERAPADTCYLELDEHAAPAELTRRKAWLNA